MGKEKYNLATGESIDRTMKFSTTNSYGVIMPLLLDNSDLRRQRPYHLCLLPAWPYQYE